MLWGESAESHPVNHLPSPWAPHLDNPFTFFLVPKVYEAWPQPFPPESIEGPAIGTSDVTCSGASYRGAARGSERFKTPPEVSIVSGKGETWIKDPQTTGGSASSLSSSSRVLSFWGLTPPQAARAHPKLFYTYQEFTEETGDLESQLNHIFHGWEIGSCGAIHPVHSNHVSICCPQKGADESINPGRLCS